MLVGAISCAMARPACTLSHHALEPKKSSLKKLTSTHAIRLVTRASKVANRTLLSAILNLKVFI